MDLLMIPAGQRRMKPALEKGLGLEGVAVTTYRDGDDLVRHMVHRDVGAIVLPASWSSEQLMPLVSLASSRECAIPIVYLAPPRLSAERQGYLARTAFDVVQTPWKTDDLVYAARNAVNARRRERLVVAREQELAILDAVGKTIISTLELKKVLNVIMEKTRELVRSEAWSLLLVDDRNEELVFSVAMGAQAEKLTDYRIKIGEGIAGWVAKECKPVVVQNVVEDRRFYGDIDSRTGFTTRSVMCVPLETRGRVLGVLEVINKMEDGLFSERDLALVTKLAGFAAIAIDNARLYHQTKMLSLTDELTKLYNSRFFNQFLDSEIRRCQRYDTNVSLVFLDLDYFKSVNDQHGHLMGSKVLLEVAQILKAGLREVDIVARYGGDEFLVILPETSIHDAGRVAERIRKAMEDHVFLAEEGVNMKLSASFGVSCFPSHASSKEDLIRKADQAMYRVKNNNRNGVWVADDRDQGAGGNVYAGL